MRIARTVTPFFRGRMAKSSSPARLPETQGGQPPGMPTPCADSGLGPAISKPEGTC